MPRAKSKASVGLGNSLMNDRFGRGKGADKKKVSQTAIERKGIDGQTYVTNQNQGEEWKKMRSVTEQGALDEFLSTAELAGTDFTAEKVSNIKIIHTDQKNPYLLSAADENAILKKQQKNRTRLTVPRRPQWDENTTKEELHHREREALLEWRRGLAELQDNQDLLMTPFERNLEVWRQLWRVIERSDLVVQIVDARNPLLFRCGDLERYVKDVDPRKKNLLLVNKADMMTYELRKAWADYFEENGISYSFFSAQIAKQLNEERDIKANEGGDDTEESLANRTEKTYLDDTQKDNGREGNGNGDTPVSAPDGAEQDKRTQILTVEELEELFLQTTPDAHMEPGEEVKNPSEKLTTVGLVGYPNVGKSSTINALLGSKKVSVSATPGKTKHFQTLYLTPTLLLCDCPGLVFPNFASTKAELVVNGILPIDQLREHVGPVTIVAQRIPKPVLEATYGMPIFARPVQDGGSGIPTASEILRAYAVARGFSTQGLGQPDESRAARFILKDYVNGKLLYCQPPPGTDEDGADNPVKKQQALLIKEAESKRHDLEAPADHHGVQKGTRADRLLQDLAPPSSDVKGHISSTVSRKMGGKRGGKRGGLMGSRG